MNSLELIHSSYLVRLVSNYSQELCKNRQYICKNFTSESCLHICLWAALAQLTDKIDPKYIIASESARSHDDPHPKKTCRPSWIFEKKAKKSFLMPLKADRITLWALICILRVVYYPQCPQSSHGCCHPLHSPSPRGWREGAFFVFKFLVGSWDFAFLMPPTEGPGVSCFAAFMHFNIQYYWGSVDALSLHR